MRRNDAYILAFARVHPYKYAEMPPFHRRSKLDQEGVNLMTNADFQYKVFEGDLIFGIGRPILITAAIRNFRKIVGETILIVVNSRREDSTCWFTAGHFRWILLWEMMRRLSNQCRLSCSMRGN